MQANSAARSLEGNTLATLIIELFAKPFLSLVFSCFFFDGMLTILNATFHK